jgi:hypothetical protein
MTIREVTYYQVACDEPGCGLDTETKGGEYTAWSDTDGAVEDWTGSDGQVLDDGRTYCEKHWKDDDDEKAQP